MLGRGREFLLISVQAMYAVGISKATLAWHLTATAAQMCLTLGYHRAQPAQPEALGSIDARAVLFWHVYTLERGLSLRLGRACVMQDWDITIPRAVDYTAFPGPWSGVLNSWIKLGDIQAKAYELL